MLRRVFSLGLLASKYAPRNVVPESVEDEEAAADFLAGSDSIANSDADDDGVDGMAEMEPDEALPTGQEALEEAPTPAPAPAPATAPASAPAPAPADSAVVAETTFEHAATEYSADAIVPDGTIWTMTPAAIFTQSAQACGQQSPAPTTAAPTLAFATVAAVSVNCSAAPSPRGACVVREALADYEAAPGGTEISIRAGMRVLVGGEPDDNGSAHFLCCTPL